MINLRLFKMELSFTYSMEAKGRTCNMLGLSHEILQATLQKHLLSATGNHYGGGGGGGTWGTYFEIGYRWW